MSAPPRLAEWLLAASLADADRDAVVGDLSEEFTSYVVADRGVMMARWWYRWQVARSLAPLFFRSWERASLLRASLAIVGAALAAALPASLLITLRTFVLQQVPLKTTAELSIGFAMMLAVVALIGIGCGLAGAVTVLNGIQRRCRAIAPYKAS